MTNSLFFICLYIFSFGLGIGKRPWLTIILSVALCLVCTAGLVFWNENTDDEELWTPYGSPVNTIENTYIKYEKSARKIVLFSLKIIFYDPPNSQKISQK